MEKRFIRRGLLLLASLLMTTSMLAQKTSLYARISYAQNTLYFYGDVEPMFNDYIEPINEGYVRFPDNDADPGEYPAWWERAKECAHVEFDISCQDIDLPIKSTAHMFDGFTNLIDIKNLQYLPTGEVTTMKAMFKDCENIGSIDLSSLDTGEVMDFSYMFYNVNWRLNKETHVAINLNGFRTDKATDMSYMFYQCGANQLDVSGFNTGNVTTMKKMFYYCIYLRSLDVSNFDTSRVTDMNGMFCECNKVTSLDVSHFNTENVTDFTNMFYDVSKINELDISNFVTAKATSMHKMFLGCIGLQSLDLSNFNTKNVTDMSGMFNSCCMSSLDLSHFNTENVTNMSEMFYNCSNLKALDLSSFNTENVTDMSSMFSKCTNLCSLDISSFNTAKVTNMQWMFSSCESLYSLDLSHFNTERVTDMSNMFSYMYLAALDVRNFSTASLTSAREMFSFCGSLARVNLFTLGDEGSSQVNVSYMFCNCKELKRLYVYKDWNTNRLNGSDSNGIFSGCSKLLGGDGTMVTDDNVGSAFAHVDHGTAQPGYFTDGNQEETFPQTTVPYARFSSNGKQLTLFGDDDPLHNDHLTGYLISVDDETGVDLKIVNVNKVNTIIVDESFASVGNLTNLSGMFRGLNRIVKICGLEHLKTDKVKKMTRMFEGCRLLEVLDLSGFSTDNVTDMSYMFNNCQSLYRLIVDKPWNLANAGISTDEYGSPLNDYAPTQNMFGNCYRLEGGNGTVYSSNRIDGGYARIDGGSALPGYFCTREQLEGLSPTTDVNVAPNEVNDVSTVIDHQEQTSAYYSLDGRKQLDGKLKPGVYIRDGRKVVVR